MNMIDLKKLFNQLPGQWILERDIQNSDGNGVFNGICTFTTMDDGRLLCKETGTLTFNGHQTDASRSYIYAYQDDGIIILYNDPHRKDEVLHQLAFEMHDNNYVAKHCHVCGNDTYDLTFTMQSDNSIEMKYVVKGPHKDYAMRSLLTRSA